MGSTFVAEISGNAYPGRGLGWLHTREEGLAGFSFATGRSAESRARRLIAVGDDAWEMVPTEHARDPLRHYPAALAAGSRLVVGNGEQVRTVAERLAAGQGPADALTGLSFEPDPPLCTPRITTVFDRARPSTVHLSTAFRSASGRPEGDVLTLTATGLRPGEGLLLTTYRSDGLNFAAPPAPLSFGADIATRAELSEALWDSLRLEYRVALAVFDPLAPVSQARIRLALDE